MPVKVTRIAFGFCCARHCVASTCSTSLVPMPNASAPKAPCVLVWLSPQTIVVPGSVKPELGTDHVDDALAAAVEVEERHAERDARCRAAFRPAARASGSAIGKWRFADVGTL